MQTHSSQRGSEKIYFPTGGINSRKDFLITKVKHCVHPVTVITTFVKKTLIENLYMYQVQNYNSMLSK